MQTYCIESPVPHWTAYIDILAVCNDLVAEAKLALHSDQAELTMYIRTVTLVLVAMKENNRFA